MIWVGGFVDRGYDDVANGKSGSGIGGDVGGGGIGHWALGIVDVGGAVRG